MVVCLFVCVCVFVRLCMCLTFVLPDPVSPGSNLSAGGPEVNYLPEESSSLVLYSPYSILGGGKGWRDRASLNLGSAVWAVT